MSTEQSYKQQTETEIDGQVSAFLMAFGFKIHFKIPAHPSDEQIEEIGEMFKQRFILDAKQVNED